ncbi:MAG: hypothetical protein CMP24_07265 [Rickettsiales bacterium]|nr:hypothetical protein [Rickettsiales bacterium]|tara:strand:+ start:95 stop:1033 length:939 start_codon:yes stop_codon:yes gene_type:complete
MNNLLHRPVLINETIECLNVRDKLTYVDATFGCGGYTKKILEKANCKVISLDRDPDVKSLADDIKKTYKNRFDFILAEFSNIKIALEKKGLNIISGGLVADLGLSSMQINNCARGFSFMQNGPLDMRMSKKGPTAEEILNSFEENELSKIFWQYGEEKNSRKLASVIVKERKLKPLCTTFELVEIVTKVVRKKKKLKIHPATKVFQALRIYLNKELYELEKLITNVEKLLIPGARLAIVSFHSLEDRIVKVLFNKLSGNIANANRHLPLDVNKDKFYFKKISRKAIKPKKLEIIENKKARSAKLRVLERLDN